MTNAAPLMALSLREPWAFAILRLGKDLENRRWSTRFRGRVVLHASKTWDEAGEEWLRSGGYDLPPRDAFTLGAYVGEVTITGCFEKTGAHKSLWAFGPYCFTLADPVSYVQAVSGRGRLGFWEIPEGERLAVIAAREAVGQRDAVLLPPARLPG